MTEAEKQLVRVLRIHLNAAIEAIKVSGSTKFNGLDAELKAMIDRLKDGGDVC